jgi:hypothetical protein
MHFMEMAVFWVVAPCSLVDVYQRFGGPCCLHHQGHRLVVCYKFTNVSEVLAASIIRAMSDRPDAGGSKDL